MALDIFGAYGMLIGQILSLIAIAGLIVQIARWSEKRHVTRDWYFFILTVTVIVSMQMFSIFRFDSASDQLTAIEQQNGVLLGKQQSQLNLTLTNQGLIKHTLAEARQDEQRAIGALNMTQHNDQILHEILSDIHIHVSNGTLLNATQLKAFDSDADRQ